MIAAKLPMSGSFAARIRYLFEGDGTDPDRVMFAEARHLLSPPRHAAGEMADTYRNRDRLKAAAGIRRGGRPCTRPVRHDVLSWADDERPSAADMATAARSYLAALGLAPHEAVIVGHRHNGRHHVHIVSNVVNPLTGKVADMTDDQRKAQAWCAAYERAQGLIRCRRRTAPKPAQALASADGRRRSAQRLTRAEWERGQRRKAEKEARKLAQVRPWSAILDQAPANSSEPPRKQKAGIVPALRP